MIVKIHKTQDGKKIVAICDEELIGKKFKEKNIQIDLSSNFYNGEKKTEKDIKKIFDDAYIVNMVGKKSVNLGKKAGIVLENNIIYVQKIPHAQTVLF
jgi:hypothetical protein